VTTFRAGTLIELHRQLQDAAKVLTQVAYEIGAYLPSVVPDEPPSELVILVAEHDRVHFVSDLSGCANMVDAARKAFDQHGGGETA
jgi:hypothetical protein